jgi:tripartite-type tricarboxylate transporter receptor subunit TctC
MSKRFLILVLTALSLGSLMLQPALGVETIEILCPYTPGSSSDLMSRLIAEITPKYLGQPMVVINKPGAGGSIAASEVVTSKPGSKLFNISQFFLATTVKTQKVPFRPDDLIPLASFMEYKDGFIVRGDSPWKTLDDVLDYARKNPGQLRWAHSGRGVTSHMAGLLIFRKAGVQTIDVPYAGSPEKLSALLGGHVDLSAMVYGSVSDHVKAGKVRYLVFFSNQRYSFPSDVPCATELGYADAGKLAAIICMYAHKDTPPKLRQALEDAFKKTCADPQFKKGIEERIGEELRYLGPESIKESIKKAEEVGVPIIKELGLYVEKK